QDCWCICWHLIMHTHQQGQKLVNVTLPCQAPNNNMIGVTWRRADLGEEYVYLNRQRVPQPQKQHPSFKNRVDLQDKEMKDRDMSLILKKVTTNDTGTYECRVFMEETQSWLSQMNSKLRLLHCFRALYSPVCAFMGFFCVWHEFCSHLFIFSSVL
uniref:Ig-like domain-containing protein n=1 Tax=Neolamprologus brichardi TaxID=32507 RepID=A0A3Q4IF94_NEOBR